MQELGSVSTTAMDVQFTLKKHLPLLFGNQIYPNFYISQTPLLHLSLPMLFPLHWHTAARWYTSENSQVEMALI